MECENCRCNHDGKYGSGRFCSIKCSSSYSSKKNKEEKNKKISDSLKGRYNGIENSIFKSGKLLSQKIEKCPICKNKFNKSYTRVYCSRSCYLKDINFDYRKKSIGGYRKGSGVGKKGWYKGYWCDSSWELAFVIYNIEHNISFNRNLLGYEYKFENKLHKYYPDFLVGDTLIEIKGYETEKDIEKYKSIGNIKLKILYKKDINDIIEYVVSKYGKNYINLYETNDPVV